MKKTLIAVAALAATGAFAQVSVYGRLDVGYANTKSTVDDAGTTTTTKANGVQSHNSASSMWGIQGSEDLGGGLKANFKLEQDVYVANGNTGTTGASGGATGTAAFNRTSLVGLSGSFGRVDLGRDYVPTFKLAAATDVNAQSRIGSVQLSGVAGSTSPNLVHYSTPNLSGFQVNVAYGNQDTSVQSAGTGASTAKVTNITATYANGPLMVGVGVGTTENRTNGAAALAPVTVSGFAAGSLAIEKTTMNIVAGSYDFGVVKLIGNVIQAKWDLNGANAGAASTANQAKGSEVNIGATMPMGKVTLIGQVGTNKLELVGDGEAIDGTDVILGVNYALSAKTNLFAKTGTYNKMSAGDYSQKTTSTAVGIRMVF